MTNGNSDKNNSAVTPEQLFQEFEKLRISYDLYHHPAVFTVKESSRIDLNIPGTHCRNMFLRDKKKRMFLVTLANETHVDLKKLEPLLGSTRLSFGSAERLWSHLGVQPGSVCPVAVINNTAKDVPLILDAWMMAQERINIHPLHNTMTISLTPHDLLLFLESLGYPYRVIDLSPAKPD
ncbi:MAG: prolyl-tRNA synthetase associated domain-containing protein [Rhodospirillales bacterium]|nr:prolyl-tRNA synthetase associated domain-containing protein [Rhodospirillales bacterium]MCB9980713.1 prolyl-tRNA synthetase associated domain-containing protein [Rhodospirillales bacterium]